MFNEIRDEMVGKPKEIEKPEVKEKVEKPK